MKAMLFIETKDGSPIGASRELFSAAETLGAEAVGVSVRKQQRLLLMRMSLQRRLPKKPENAAPIWYFLLRRRLAN